MSRTSEMKLHSDVRAINGTNKMIHSFYDTHIRLWTSYIEDEDGSIGPCSYACSRADAISECIIDNTDWEI